MFKRLYVDNYKCLVNFDLEFQDLTLLLGRTAPAKRPYWILSTRSANS